MLWGWGQGSSELCLGDRDSWRIMMSRAWNTANWTPAGGSITSLWYVCMYVCMSVTKTSSIFSKSAPTISISINNLMLKVTCRLMHWVPLFGPLGPLGKAYQMTWTVSIWYISSGVIPKSWADDIITSGVRPKYWADDVNSSGVMPKNRADDVIIWDNSAGSKNSMGQVHHTVILRLNAQAHGPGLISGFWHADSLKLLFCVDLLSLS